MIKVHLTEDLIPVSTSSTRSKSNISDMIIIFTGGHIDVLLFSVYYPTLCHEVSSTIASGITVVSCRKGIVDM